METFNGPREFVDNPSYLQDRKKRLKTLDLDAIDEPIRDIIAGFSTLQHCFTLQCCYGHFICSAGQNPHSLQPLPHHHQGPVRYRIAYIAFCLVNNRRGMVLHDSLSRVSAIDPDNVQYGSPDWFWQQQVNSYALQVEPFGHRFHDEAMLEVAEARRLQKTRDLFFDELRELLAKERRVCMRG